MKKILLSAVCLVLTTTILAQSDDDNKNVVISNSQREFRFEKGNAANPVLIKEKSSRKYLCNNYRTDISIAEFYNDMERIDDVDILIDGSKKHQIKPAYDFYSSEGIFYSDARVCHFSLPLLKMGATCDVTFEKTVLDPRYFTSVHFMEQERTVNQEIKIIVPNWMKVEFKEFNFEKFNIKRTVTKNADETVYAYKMTDLPGLRREASSPGVTYYAPHVLVLTKSAETSAGKQTYFNTIADQYNWYHSLVAQIGDDVTIVKQKADEITKGITNENEKVKMIYQWVQDNIRYIAFEDGIAGFKPEKSQEVLRKKYGDCKGMANLLTEMLKSQGLDARRCWIGTKHLAYDYSTPCLAVDNHMIAVWMNGTKPVYLDATEKYIGFGEFAERIQGRQTLIEDGSKYILGRVPSESYLQNTAFEKRVFTIEGSHLKGHITQTWKGENKEMMLSGLNSIKKDKQENALSRFLADGKTNFEISALNVNNMTDYNKDLKVEYDVAWKNAVSEFGDDTYLEVDNRRSLENFKIDTAKRKLPYWFYFKNHLVFETEMNLPAGKKITTLPDKMEIKRPTYNFIGNYVMTGNKLTYRCELILNDSEIKPAQFAQWNNDIEQLKNFYNQQIVLTKIK